MPDPRVPDTESILKQQDAIGAKADQAESVRSEQDENAAFMLQLYRANQIYRSRQGKAGVKEVANLPSYVRIHELASNGNVLSPMEREMMRVPVQKILTEYAAEKNQMRAKTRKALEDRDDPGIGFSVFGAKGDVRLSDVRAATEPVRKFVSGATFELGDVQDTGAKLGEFLTGGDFSAEDIAEENERLLAKARKDMPGPVRTAYEFALDASHLVGAVGPLRGTTAGLIKAGIPPQVAGPMSLAIYGGASAEVTKSKAEQEISRLSDKRAKMEPGPARDRVTEKMRALQPFLEIDPGKAAATGLAFGAGAGLAGKAVRGFFKPTPEAANAFRQAVSKTPEKLQEAVAEYISFGMAEAAIAKGTGEDFGMSDFNRAGLLGVVMSGGKPVSERGRGSAILGEGQPAEAPPLLSKQRGSFRWPFENTGSGDGTLTAGKLMTRLLGEIHSAVKDVGGRAGQKAHVLATKSENSARSYRGKMSQELDAALEAVAGKGPMLALRTVFTKGGRELGRAYRDISRIQFDSEGNAKVRLYELIEGREQPGTMAERKIVDAARALIDKRGQLFEDAGVVVKTADGAYAFQNRGGMIAPRVFVGSWHAMLAQNHPALKQVVKDIARMNGMAEKAAQEFVDGQVKSMGEGISELTVRQTQAENTREIKFFPAAVRWKGKTIPLLESEPAMYFDKLVELGSARLGVIENMGQEIAPADMVPKKLRKQLEKAQRGGDTMAVDELAGTIAGLERQAPRQDRRPSQIEAEIKANGGEAAAAVWRRSMRAMHRLPIDNRVSSGMEFVETLEGGGSRLLRAYRNVKELAKASMLSGSAVPNLIEFAGNMRDVSMIASRDPTGVKNLSKSMWTAFKDGFKFLSGDAARANAILQLELMAGVTKDIANYNINPNKPLSSLIRNLSQFSGRLFAHRYINEYQEGAMGVGLMDAVARVKEAGEFNPQFYRIAKSAGVSKARARKLASGLGTEAEYNDFIASASGRLTSSTLHPGEVSYLEHNRISRNLLWFQRWGLMSARHSYNRAKTMIENISDHYGDKNLTGAQKARLSMKEATSFGNHIIGKGVNQAVAYILYSWAMGGNQGRDDALKRAGAHPVKFIRDSMVYGLFGGVHGTILRTMAEGGSVTDISPPVSLAKRFWAAQTGDGSFRNLDWWDRQEKLALSIAPGARIGHTVLAASGVSDSYLHDLKTAKRAYWQWRDDMGTIPTGSIGKHNDEVREWHVLATKAKSLLQEGRPEEEVAEMFMRAWASRGYDSEKGPRSARASLMQSRILSKHSEEELESLKGQVSEKTWNVMVEHDRIIERFADAWFPTKSQKRKSSSGNPFSSGGGSGGNPFSK